MEKKTSIIAVDLDGTILDFSWEKWVKYGVKYLGKPKAFAIPVLKFLQSFGYKIVVHTARINSTYQDTYTDLCKRQTQLESVLKKYGVPFDEIWTGNGKPIADFYIDDKAIKFINWQQILKEIIEKK